VGRSSPDGRRTTLVVIASGNFTQLGSRFLLGALVPLVLTDFATSKSRIGLALTGMWAVYALLQFPSGVLSDRYGERPIVLLGLGGTVGGTLLVALAPSLPTYTLFVVLLGAGAGLYFSPASSLVSRLYEDHGGALSALTASGMVSGIVYPALGSLIGVRFGWRVAMVFASVATLPVLVATVRTVPALASLNLDRSLWAGVNIERLHELLSRPSVVYTTAVAVIVVFTFQALSSFLVTFLVEHRGITPGLAGVIFGIVFSLSAMAQPVAGKLSDRFSRDPVIGASLTIAVAGLMVLLVVPSTIGLIVGVGVLGVGVSWSGPVQARFMDQFDESERGYGFGLTRTVYMLLASSGSVVVGTLADIGGWFAGYGIVVFLLLVSLGLLATNRVLRLGL